MRKYKKINREVLKRKVFASLLNDENLRLEAAMFVREHGYRKGEANLNAKSFCQWVNNELLPSSDLPPNMPRSISVRTATRWHFENFS